MFVQHLNLYSIIIPIFMMMLGCVLVGLQWLRIIPIYLVMYGYSTALTGCALLLYSIISPEYLPQLACVVTSLLFFSVAFFSYAVSLRLKVQVNWRFMLLSIAIAEAITFYYSIIDEHYVARLTVLGITPCILFAHNLYGMYRKNMLSRLDHLLRLSVALLIGVVVLRIGYLMFILTPGNAILGNSFLFATIQFLILILSMGLVVLMLCCAFQDVFHQLRKERNLDPLTGLLNRRGLEERLHILSLQPQAPNIVMVCDIDHFKKINDQYGHHVGDLALKHLAQIMRQCMRNYDDLCRIGGEEFIVVLHDTPLTKAIAMAEHLRQQLEYCPMIYQQQHIKITLSIGITRFYTVDDYAQAAQLADDLLYQAKKFGRNNVQWELQD